MASISFNKFLLPDPELVAKAISHIREINQTTIDALDADRKGAVRDSEPWKYRKDVNKLEPTGFKSVIA